MGFLFNQGKEEPYTTHYTSPRDCHSCVSQANHPGMVWGGQNLLILVYVLWLVIGGMSNPSHGSNTGPTLAW